MFNLGQYDIFDFANFRANAKNNPKGEDEGDTDPVVLNDLEKGAKAYFETIKDFENKHKMLLLMHLKVWKMH